MVFPPDAKPARKECNRRGLFSTGGCHVNKMALKILCVLSKTRQQKWALFRSIRISSAHRRTRALRLICSCPYSLTSITHGDSSHTPQYKHFTVSSEIDAVKGTPSSTGRSGDQPSRCLWCQSNIKHAEIKRSAADPAAQLQDDQLSRPKQQRKCATVYTHCNLQRVLN